MLPIMLILILLFAIGGHFLFPVVGAALAITAGVWAILVGAVAMISIAIVLFFCFSGAGIVVTGLLAFLGAIIAIVLLPLLLPILLPLLLVMAFVGYIRRKEASASSGRVIDHDDTP